MPDTHVTLFVLTDDVIEESIRSGTIRIMFDVRELCGETKLGNNAILARLYDSKYFGLNMYDSPEDICDMCKQNNTRCPGHPALVDLGFRYVLPLYVGKIQSMLNTKDVASPAAVEAFRIAYPDQYERYTSRYLVVRPPCARLEFMKDKNLQQLIHSQITYESRSLNAMVNSTSQKNHTSKPKTVYRPCEYYPILNKLISSVEISSDNVPVVAPEIKAKIVTMIHNMAIGKVVGSRSAGCSSSLPSGGSGSNDAASSVSNTMYMSVSTNNNAMIPSDDIRRDVASNRYNGSVTNNIFSGGRIHMSMLDVLAHKKGLFRQMYGGTRPMYTVRGVIVCDTDIDLWQVGVPPKVYNYVRNKDVFLCRHSSGMQLIQPVPYDDDNLLVLSIHHELSGSFNQDYDGDEMTLYVSSTSYKPCEPDAILNSLPVLLFSEINGMGIIKCSYNTVMAIFVLTSWPDERLDDAFVDYLRRARSISTRPPRTYRQLFEHVTYEWMFGASPVKPRFPWTFEKITEAFGKSPWTKKTTNRFNAFAVRICKGYEEDYLRHRGCVTRLCDDFMTQYGFDLSAQEMNRCSKLFKAEFGKIPEHFKDTKDMVYYWQKITSSVMSVLDERDTLSVMINSGAKATSVHLLQALGCIGPSIVNFYSRNYVHMCKDVGVCVFDNDGGGGNGDVACAWLSDCLWDGLRPVQQFIMSCNSIENMVRSIVCTGEGGYWRRSVQFTLDGLSVLETYSVCDADHDGFVYPPVCNVGGAAKYVSGQFFARFGIPYFVNGTEDVYSKCVDFDAGVVLRINGTSFFVDSDGGLVRETTSCNSHYIVNSLLAVNNLP